MKKLFYVVDKLLLKLFLSEQTEKFFIQKLIKYGLLDIFSDNVN
jgi:hypothetical protein